MSTIRPGLLGAGDVLEEYNERGEVRGVRFWADGSRVDVLFVFGPVLTLARDELVRVSA